MIDSASANPWLGLNTYKENDRLYGRDREAEEVSDIIENNLLTIIYGRSGIGKSSLLQAGVFPRLRYNDQLPVYIRLEHNSETEYISQIVSKIQNESEKSKTNLICSIDISSIRTLAQLAASVTAQDGFTLIPRNITLVFDQFEELFTLPDKAHRQAMNEFFSQLSEMLNNTDSEHDLRIVICLREDYLYFLEQASVNVPSLKRNRYSLQGLTRGQGRDVICLPRKGLVSEELAENILDKIDPEHSDVIAPAILSLFMHELYEKGKGSITQENISLFGDHIISNFYENGMKSVSPLALAFLEDRLVTSDGYRHFISYNDALAHGVTAEELERLKQRRIITIEKGVKGQQLIEFSHDVLCPIVMRNRKERQLNEETERLRAKNKAIKKRQVFIVSLVLIALGLVCVFAGMYLMMKNEREQMLANQSRFVAKEAMELAEKGDYIKAMALVAEVYPKNISKPERPFVHEAYDVLRIINDSTANLEKIYDLGTRVNEAVFSNDGRYIAVKKGLHLYIWDTKNNKCLTSIDGIDPYSFNFSNDSRYLLLEVYNNPDCQIYDIQSKKFVGSMVLVDSVFNNGNSTKRKYNLTVSDHKTAEIYEKGSNNHIKSLSLPDWTIAADLSEDGTRLTSISQDGTAYVLKLNFEAQNQISADNLSELALKLRGKTYFESYELIEQSRRDNIIYYNKLKDNLHLNLQDNPSIQLSQDKKYLITASSLYSMIRVWDVKNGECISFIPTSKRMIYADFSKDGEKIVAISNSGNLYTWNFTEPQELINLTIKKLNNYRLNEYDRRTYYLE